MSAICVISNTLYVWHNMNSMCHHNHSFWHEKTLFMTSHPHYSWHHTHCIRHDIHSTCDITATVTMTRHLLCFWHYSQCIWHLIFGMFDNILTVSDMIPMYLCNQTNLINDITPYVRMKSHPLHVWHHRHFIYHVHSCWQHTIVCTSWHTLCLWHHMHYIWCHPYCVYDYPSSISDLKPMKTAISSILCHHTLSVKDITPTI